MNGIKTKKEIKPMNLDNLNVLKQPFLREYIFFVKGKSLQILIFTLSQLIYCSSSSSNSNNISRGSSSNSNNISRGSSSESKYSDEDVSESLSESEIQETSDVVINNGEELFSDVLGEKIRKVIQTNENIALDATKTFAALQELIPLESEKQTEEIKISIPENLKEAIKIVEVLEGKIEIAEALVYDALKTLTQFILKQPESEKKNLFYEEVEVNIIQAKVHTIKESEMFLDNLQNLKMKIRTQKNLFFVKLKLALFEILGKRKNAIETTKIALNGLKRIILAEKRFLFKEKNEAVSVEMIKPINLKKKSVNAAIKAFKELSELIEMEDEKQENILSRKALENLTNEIERTTNEIEEVMESIVFSLKELIDYQRQTKTEENFLLCLEEIDALKDKICSKWSSTDISAKEVLSILQDKISKKQENKDEFHKTFYDLLMDTKPPRDKLFIVTKAVLKYLKEHYSTQIDELSFKVEENLLSPAIKKKPVDVRNDVCEEAGRSFEITYNVLENLIETQEKLFTELENAYDDVHRSLNDLKDILLENINEDSLIDTANMEEIKELVKNLVDSVHYVLIENIIDDYMNIFGNSSQVQVQEENTMEKKIESCEIIIKEVFSNLPHIKESAKNKAEEAIEGLLQKTQTALKLTYQFIPTKEIIEKIMDALMKISKGRMTERFTYISANTALDNAIYALREIREKMSQVLKKFTEKYEIRSIVRKKSPLESLKNKFLKGRIKIKELEDSNISLKQSLMDIKVLLVESKKRQEDESIQNQLDEKVLEE